MNVGQAVKASSYVDREAWAGVENAEEAVLKVRGKSLKSSGRLRVWSQLEQDKWRLARPWQRDLERNEAMWA